jgi:N6-L-threonylcarbamoyladenine synthase
MRILGVETSCDETGIAILEIKKRRFKIKANLIASQAKLHAKYGGVFPDLAKREHKKNLPKLFSLIGKNILKFPPDLIGVTVGPGLDPCLWQGIEFAKKIAKNLKIPAVPANHLISHLLSNFLDFPIEKAKNFYPALGLLVSGGHTQLVFMEKFLKFKILGETRDDAAGECFDKCARILGLPYPGGPEIEKLAKKFPEISSKIPENLKNLTLPRPMIHQKNYDFSFAGLKTAVLYDFMKRTKKEREGKIYKILMAKEVQDAVFDVLVAKTKRAQKEFKIKKLFFGGGVMANETLRKRIKKEFKVCQVLIPKKEFCLDNGLLPAIFAFFFSDTKTTDFEKIKSLPNLSF